MQRVHIVFRSMVILSMVFALSSLSAPVRTSAAPQSPTNTWNAIGTGLGSSVMDIAVCGSDVYVGGYFQEAGGSGGPSFIARWDGSSWNTLGTSGLNAAVNDIEIVGSDVYVAGNFSSVDGVPGIYGVARWNMITNTWSALGAGVGPQFAWALASMGSDLYVAGQFDSAGYVANTAMVARWDGSTWYPLGSGISKTDTVYDRITALKAEGGTLYVGGHFTDAGGIAGADNIASWNGSAWNALGSGLSMTSEYQTPNVWDIEVVGKDVYAGGDFENAGGNASGDYIARWDGSAWYPLGDGLTNTVYALDASGPNLYVGGYFTDAGGHAEGDHIARWNGKGWLTLDSGVDNMINAISVEGPQVYVGGEFTSAGGVANTSHIARWDTSDQAPTWVPLDQGLNDIVLASIVVGADTYIGGAFTDAGGINEADKIVRWDGSAWHALGDGLNDNVHAITAIGADIYVGGEFTDAGGIPEADYIARWDGSAWHALDNGLNGVVLALETAGGDLIAGGGFTNAGGEANADIVASWDGSGWHALGSGLKTSASVFDQVYALEAVGGNLYAGGTFSDGGSDSDADYVAYWNGSNWSWPGGSSLSYWVTEIEAVGPDVYLGGYFQDAGSNEGDRIVRWDGSAYHALGSGLSNAVFEIELVGPDVYAGGDFSDFSGDCDYIARWDGSAWQPVGGGVNNNVRTINNVGPDLYVGGFFLDAGGDTASDRIARLGGPFNSAPTSEADSYDSFQGVTLNVDAADGVLANDGDADLDSLSAVLVSAPAAGEGTLVLNADGSFTFTPAGGFSGPVTFTYQASDGTLTSTVTTVTIQVDPNSLYLPLIKTPE
jgi:hypothetical protein